MSKDLIPSLSNAFTKYYHRQEEPKLTTFSYRKFAARDDVLESSDQTLATATRQFEIQRAIRPIFGKGEPNPAVIGDHPDFAHLAQTGGFESHQIATLFMDIEASTRMSLLVDLPTVYKIKNAFITAAIEIVQAFDGHVHRIMGDAVMAFFGGKGITGEQSVIDAMNAASLLRYFAEKVVVPSLKPEVAIDTLGIRLGVDYGKDEDVLWGRYGHPGTCEVSATSFYVDIAAKLQGNAGRNEILIGDSIKRFIDFPGELVGDKTQISNGTRTSDLYISPNHTDGDGKPRNYRKFVLKWDDYLRCTPVARAVKDLPNSIQQRMPDTVDLRVYISEKQEGVGRQLYAPCSKPVAKGSGILFELNLRYQPRTPFDLVFRVENHGDEAYKLGGEQRSNHDTTKPVIRNGYLVFSHWEAAAYRGLHYMTIILKDSRGVQWQHRVGIFVD